MYEFRTPTRTLPVDQRHPLWRRVNYQQGYAVIKRTDGSYELSLAIDRERADVAFVYDGGHVHTIDDTEAAALTAAGYGAYLTEVS